MINLSPPEIKQRKGLKSLVYVVTMAYFVIASLLVLGLAGLATYNFTQKIALDNQKAELDRLTEVKNKDKALISQAAFIQNRVKNVANYRSTYDWNQVLSSLAQSTPTNTQLTSVKISGDASKPPIINITGSSADRRSIILFKDKLAITSPFTGASITAMAEPASDETKSFTFSISVSVAKK